MFRIEKNKLCLMPMDLFEIEVDLVFSEKKPKSFLTYKLPRFSELFDQEPFAELGLYYNEEGIGGTLVSKVPFQEALYPDYPKGEALELFISTRDMQKASSVSRFCHQFVLFPVQIGGFYGKELSHFRGEDSRPLCDPLPVEVESSFEKKGYTLDFFIPKSALYGFEGMAEALSFTYILYAKDHKPQYFSVSSENFNVGQMPSLWARACLKLKE